MTEASSQSLIYLETNFFIKAVEGTAETAGPPKKLLGLLRQRPGLACTSELTFAETLAPPKRPDALPLNMKRRVYLDLLIWSAFIALLPITREVLIETADLRAVARMKLADAIHLVSAVRSGCRYVVTSDSDFKSLPAGVERVEPDETGIEHILSALA
ncbi:MAG: PIN domain-containing protein [Pseudolabrys sp.]|jgi:predicted nucleic acid-binding protein